MRQRPPVFRLAPAAALVALLALAACGSDEESAGRQQPQVKVVATLSVFADFVREIGGDRVEVSSLLPAGADPHTYQPVPRDVQRVTEADLVFANGLDLEAGALNVIEPNLPSDVALIELGEEAVAAGVSVGQFGEGADPHLWLSVEYGREYARIIYQALVEADPAGRNAYEESYRRYLGTLDELEEYVRDKVSSVAPGRRKLVTTHDAFGYLADYVGFEVVAFVVVSPGQDPSPGGIADLAQAIEEQNVPAVFTEPQVGADSRLLEQIAADVGARVCTLYSDTLDDSVPSYIEMMRFNADQLLRCLGGEVG